MKQRRLANTGYISQSWDSLTEYRLQTEEETNSERGRILTFREAERSQTGEFNVSKGVT